MRPPVPICISGQGVYFPDRMVDLQAEVMAGRLARELYEEERYETICMEPTKTVSDMAFEAASSALMHDPPTELGSILFANSTPKDRETWSVSADLARRLCLPGIPFLDLYQGCNGLLAAVEIGIQRLAAGTIAKGVLCVSAERFPKEFGERWEIDTQNFLGDGAGAWLLEKGTGPGQILAYSARFHAEYNDFIYREFGSALDLTRETRKTFYSPRKTKKEFIARVGLEPVVRTWNELTRGAVKDALASAKLTLSDIAYFVYPNYGWPLFREMLGYFSVPVEKSSWEIGRRRGHMGCVDPASNLWEAVTTGRVLPGDRVLVLSHAAGISAMVLIVQV